MLRFSVLLAMVVAPVGCIVDSVKAAEPVDFTSQSARFADQGLRADVFDIAMRAYRKARKRGQTNKTTFAIIDYTLPSTQKRLWVIDLESGTLLHRELVTHGSRSGGNQPRSFSNIEGSHQSSLGLARTAETYYSAKFGGTALRLDGLEAGINDNMRARAIVMHPADYATPAAIRANGGSRLGRSQGCPAMDPKVSASVINDIKNGSLVFSYYNDADYLSSSSYLN